MPEPITITIVSLLLAGVGAAAVLSFWSQILGWAQDSLFPWIESNLPSISNSARFAFHQLSEVASNIRRQIKTAWMNLREYLLKQTLHLQRKSSSKWTAVVTSWVIKVLGPKPTVIKVTTETEVDWDYLPGDVREKFMRENKKQFDRDVTEIRDREMELVNY